MNDDGLPCSACDPAGLGIETGNLEGDPNPGEETILSKISGNYLHCSLFLTCIYSDRRRQAGGTWLQANALTELSRLVFVGI